MPQWFACAAVLAVIAQVALPALGWLHERFADDDAGIAHAEATSAPLLVATADGPVRLSFPTHPHHHDHAHCAVCQTLATTQPLALRPALLPALDRPVTPGAPALESDAAPVRPFLPPAASPRAPPLSA